MSNGRLLVDEDAARHFCREFLLPYPQCPRLLQCVARKKYAKDDPQQEWHGPGLILLERTILYFDQGQASEDAFVRALRKIQVLADAGLYTNPRCPEQVIPASWMVVYITAYPLDEDDAADALVNKVLTARQTQRRAQANGKDYTSAGLAHLVSKVETLLHQHPSRAQRWLKLDIDTKEAALLEQLYSALGQHARLVRVVQTRGGFHVVLEKGPCCQTLYALAKRVNAGVPQPEQWLTIENNDGPMLAIPGTSQGGFSVQDVTEEWRGKLLQQEQAGEGKTVMSR